MGGLAILGTLLPALLLAACGQERAEPQLKYGSAPAGTYTPTYSLVPHPLYTADLKGKVVSYPSPTALAAAMMPQYFLHRNGIDVNKDIRNLYVGSQESSIMSVYLGSSAAGATWPPPWRLFQKERPAEAAQLEVIWETPSLVNNSVMARDDVPDAVRQVVRQALLDLDRTTEGKGILAGMETARFHPCDDAGYDVVRKYVARFEKEVRPVEAK